ncbi:MAG: arsenate reductase [Bacteroidia bacterium]
MTTLYYLGSCDTCRRIMKQWQIGPDALLREIKSDPVRPDELDTMRALAGSYEALFSKRALKFREMGLHTQTLGEADYRRLILEEYTFLRRPVLVLGDAIFIGNAPATVAAAAQALDAARATEK